MQQQTGMPFRQTQHIQPPAIMAFMQSQQAVIIWAMAISPEVQVSLQPIVVISHLHDPTAMLQQHMHMPFIIMQHEHSAPGIMLMHIC